MSALLLAGAAVKVALPNDTTPFNVVPGDYWVRTTGEALFIAETGSTPARTEAAPAFLVDNFPVLIRVRSGTVTALNDNGVAVQSFWAPAAVCGCKV